MISLSSRLALAAGLVLLALSALAPPAGAAPAWWRVSDGHAEVWVLGGLQIAPQDMAWDTGPLERRLAGASQLIVPAQAHGGTGAFIGLLGAARSSSPMEASLAPPLRRRFDAVAASAGKDAKHYDGWKPAMAGVMLSNDVYKAAGLKAGDVDSKVRRLAHAAGVREAPAGAYDAGDMASAIKELSPAGQQLCLSATLRGIELGAPRLKADAAAWARGDPRPLPQDADDLACLAAMPGMKTLTDRNLASAAAAIAAALKTPGRSLAVLDVRQLITPGGVLERLRARGLTVQGPLP